MAALDFPASPTVGQVFVGGNGVIYTWNGTVWLASGASAGGDFCVTAGSVTTVPTTFTTLIPNSVITGNSGSWYSTSTGRYTPPAGRYYIEATLSISCTSASTLAISLRKNGTQVQQDNSYVPAAGAFAEVVASATLDANGTDFFDIQGISTIATGAITGLLFQAFPISGIKGPPGDPTPGTLLQTVSYQTGAVATGTTLIPADDTIPQITEGDQYMTLAITPRSATSRLLIEVTFNGAHSSTSTPATCVALFQDSTANALAASFAQVSGGDIRVNVKFTHAMVSGTTSVTTFRVRAGAHVAGTLTFNGGGGARTYGGVIASSIVIQEVAP